MFRAPPDAPTVEVIVEGNAILVPQGTTAAAAALLAGLLPTRTNPADGSPRAPYCMMGACLECLMTIDGTPSRQACLIPVHPGMVIARQDGRRRLG